MLASPAPVASPRTLADALAMRNDHPEATVLAGGTDVFVYMEAGVLAPTRVINLWGCAGLSGIGVENGALRLGANTTYTQLIQHPLVPNILKEAALTVGAVQIQNRGTIGGNICNGSPAGDTLPVWLALDAEFELQNIHGKRRVPAAEYWLGYKISKLQPNELLVAVHVPDLTGSAHFRKVGTRMAQSISKVVFAARRADGLARIAFGAVGPIPFRVREAEAAVVRGASTDEIVALVGAGIAPITDVRSTKDYRLRVAGNIVRRWLAW